MTQTHFISKDHGYPGFSASREPVLRVTPGEGDRITFETDDAAYEQMHEHHDMEALTAPLNPVTGPVYVEGAAPGAVLAVHVHDITFKGVGWPIYLPAAGALADTMGKEWLSRRIELDGNTVRLTEKHTCPIEPMIGCIGVAAAEGDMSTVMPSYPTGGNMDMTDVAPGSTVYLPVQVAARCCPSVTYTPSWRGVRPLSWRSRPLVRPPSRWTCTRRPPAHSARSGRRGWRPKTT